MFLIRIFAITAIAVAIQGQMDNDSAVGYIKAIDEVLKKSNTIVIVVVERKVQLVAPDIQTPSQLAPLRDVLKNNKVMFIKAMFKSGSTKDVVGKLNNISKNYATFLAYFRTTQNAPQPVKGSVITETTKPSGLLGNLLSGLGIHDDDAGLVPDLLNTLGIKTDRKEIQKIEFEG